MILISILFLFLIWMLVGIISTIVTCWINNENFDGSYFLFGAGLGMITPVICCLFLIHEFLRKIDFEKFNKKVFIKFEKDSEEDESEN